MIPINSIEIPERFKRLCATWYGGMGCMLYAIASTGGLTTGTDCQVTDYTDHDDKMRRWYYSIWRDLSYDVGMAVCAADDYIVEYPVSESCSTRAEHADLVEFQGWVDKQVARLYESYGLEDWG